MIADAVEKAVRQVLLENEMDATRHGQILIATSLRQMARTFYDASGADCTRLLLLADELDPPTLRLERT